LLAGPGRPRFSGTFAPGTLNSSHFVPESRYHNANHLHLQYLFLDECWQIKDLSKKSLQRK
jgi:hypothetical protein